ncbi:similar to Saccharomyces cerevisiae YPR113W PIS1 Phosphatidylinositol synthase [Maudiozyma barnettii]|uniref:CDP-diacylglycerol--inositol 3-phosphatidyltransferase n=1 Tax=Maudiozyma barnettii TaxID=61262 RepID=A0A8H2ZHF7_9SACH|nr:CDP-diacylglycerol--inositol 3-phosphatidyltransferase [Kazachstania barnettii]CAB4252084.1 similar to Saccharomyces cerevisiae YPR113W PIS1 Phosphatidylinositol synthase [Kazachstania barnettii]CAD1778585.1 similar to Saccharomyces cerevisiae YPR113W PIS1 Phosphatidylinositol synthase [Kazachstania barnettii]
MSSESATVPATEITAEDVLWYIPNKIGYARAVTAVISFFTMQNCPISTAIVYTASCLLDALDGTMARKYNQVSRLGAVLDMVTDRSTTAGLLCFLTLAYPTWGPFFQVLLALDITSHYMHMYASLAISGGSHKNVTKESSALLHLYYSRRDVLFTVCFFNESFFGGLYWMAFDKYYTAGKWIAIISFPLWAFKQFANVIQLQRAALMLATEDAKDANERNKAK